MNRAFSAAIVAASSLASDVVAAQDGAETETRMFERGISDNALDTFGPGPVLPPRYVSESSTYWRLGVGVEHYGGSLGDGDTLVGPTATFRWASFGPHALFLAKPSFERYEEARVLLGLGTRVHFSLLGGQFSYGVGTHAEVRLEDHFWLLYVTPLELGGVVYSHRTLDIELFLGARHPIAGQLIQQFLVDPNGFDNEDARDRLDRVKHEWLGFGRIVFSRRID